MKQFILFLALGISLIGNNFLTPIVLSETKDLEKKQEYFSTNQKIFVKLKEKARLLNNQATLHYSLGEYKKAESLFKESLEINKNVLGLEHTNTSTSLNNLGKLYKVIGEYKKAEPLLKKSLEIRKKVLGLDHADTLTVLNNLGVLYTFIGDY